MNNETIQNQELFNDEQVIKLVIARLKTIPGTARLSIGGDSTEGISPSKLIEEVKNKTELGKKIIETQLFFIRSLQDLPV